MLNVYEISNFPNGSQCLPATCAADDKDIVFQRNHCFTLLLIERISKHRVKVPRTISELIINKMFIISRLMCCSIGHCFVHSYE